MKEMCTVFKCQVKFAFPFQVYNNIAGGEKKLMYSTWKEKYLKGVHYFIWFFQDQCERAEYERKLENFTFKITHNVFIWADASNQWKQLTLK